MSVISALTGSLSAGSNAGSSEWLVSGVEAYTADLGSNTYLWEGFPTNFMSVVYYHGGFITGVMVYPIGNPGAVVTVTGTGGTAGHWVITFSGPLGAGPFVAHSA